MSKVIIKMLPGLICLIPCVSVKCNQKVAKKRPNILIAIADDATWFSWKQYSNINSRFVETPAFDRVASEGVVFTNCYTQNPKSAPSRACLLTGRSTWQLEEASMHCSIFPSKFDVYPDILERSGYKVGYTGKGWEPGNWERGGFKHNPAGPVYNKMLFKDVPTTGISKIDYASNFDAFLSERETDQPFCFWYGGREPHRPYEFGSGLRNGKKLESAVVLPFWPDNDIVRTDLLDYAFETEWFDKQLNTMISILEKNGELDNTIIIVTADNGMSFPRCKGNVFDEGVHLPLAIMWKSKVKGGRKVSDFVNFRDFAPTMLEITGLHPNKRMSGYSFLPQLLSPKSGQIDSKRNFTLLGREVHEEYSYPVRAIKMNSMLYIRNYDTKSAGDGPLYTAYKNGYNSGWIKEYPTDIQVLKEMDKGDSSFFKLDVGSREPELLYNLENDPYCMKNLIKDKSYTRIKKNLIKKMDVELKKDKDPRILGNGKIFESYPFIH